jgi:uncharacterized phage-associated protein
MNANNFQRETSIHAILYILKKMGGKCDIHKCNKILYFADNKHLSKWGRSITGDAYIAMEFGAVPSYIYDMLKAVRGNSYFSEQVNHIRNNQFKFINNKDIVSLCDPHMDWLSESEVEALDESIAYFKDMDFKQVTEASHGYAWSETARNKEITIRDRLTEMGDTDEFIKYVNEMNEIGEPVI